MNSSSSNHKEYTEVELKNLLVDHNSVNDKNRYKKARNNNVNLKVQEDVEYIEEINETKINNNSRTLTENSRVQWSSYMEYLLSIIGFVIDLGNVWRY